MPSLLILPQLRLRFCPLVWLQMQRLAWIADSLSSDWGSAKAAGKSRVVAAGSQERDLTESKDYVLGG